MKTKLTLFVLAFGFNAIGQVYFSEDFEPSGGTLDQNNAWTTQIITAHPDGYDWYHSDFGGDAFAKVSNYNNTTSSNSPMETWLISPLIDLSLATSPTLNFENVKRFSGADLNVLISTDYTPSTAINHTITSAGLSWSPSTLNISVGDTVTWINTGGNHNVNGTTTTFPLNPQSFGNSVGTGWTYQFVFTVAGTYNYQCDPHATMGMNGIINVQPTSSVNWTDITSLFNMDTDISSWSFVNSGDVDISQYITASPGTVALAFQYQGGASDGSTYEIDDLIVTEGNSGPNVVSIYDIQFTTSPTASSPYQGQQINTGGIVTYVRPDDTYYLQSGSGPWSGVYVYDSISNVNAGDSITISCEVDEFFGLTELKNINNLNVFSQGNSVVSNSVSSSQANSEKFEGCLVSVYSATCTNASAGFGEWTINDGSGPCNVDDFIFPFTPTLNSIYDVTGLVDYSFGSYKILPRDIDDIDELTSNCLDCQPSNFSIYPNPCSTNNLHVFNPEQSLLSIFSADGKCCLQQNLKPGNHSIDISDYSSGYYLIRFGENYKKLIIE